MQVFWTAAIKLLAHNLEESRIVLTPALAHAALATKVGAHSLAKNSRQANQCKQIGSPRAVGGLEAPPMALT